MMDLLTLAQARTHLKKTAATHGGEWVGPCPACGGRDRFHVWPAKTDSRRSERVGIYWCRVCGRAGDVIQFLVDFEGKSYREAFAALGLEMPFHHEHEYATPRPPAARPTAPRRPTAEEATLPAPPAANDAWAAKAAALVDHAAASLLENTWALGWLKKRGINKKTAAGMRLGWLAEDHFRPRSAWGLPEVLKEDGTPKMLWIPSGLVIPLMGPDGRVLRVRIRRFTDREPRYYVLPGSSMRCMTHGLPSRAAVIVESELDAVLLAAVAGDLAGVVALGSSTARPDPELAAALSACRVILVSLDSDRAGASAWLWWRSNYPCARRWPVPEGKDPGEAHAAGLDVRAWVMAGLPAGWFLGPSPTGFVPVRMEERRPDAGRAAKARPPAAEACAACAATHVADQKTPAALEELYALLKAHPVSIRIARDGSRVHIRESQAWRRMNWETSRRISELVFLDPRVLEHLLGLGVEVVTWRTLMGCRE